MTDPLDPCARQANRAVGCWYGQRQYFAAPKVPPQSCEEWFKAHWRRFPATSPDGGQIIDGESVEISGFLDEPIA